MWTILESLVIPLAVSRNADTVSCYGAMACNRPLRDVSSSVDVRTFAASCSRR